MSKFQEKYEDFLAHYGVPGMQWGRRGKMAGTIDNAAANQNAANRIKQMRREQAARINARNQAKATQMAAMETAKRNMLKTTTANAASNATSGMMSVKERNNARKARANQMKKNLNDALRRKVNSVAAKSGEARKAGAEAAEEMYKKHSREFEIGTDTKSFGTFKNYSSAINEAFRQGLHKNNPDYDEERGGRSNAKFKSDLLAEAARVDKQDAKKRKLSAKLVNALR